MCASKVDTTRRPTGGRAPDGIGADFVERLSGSLGYEAEWTGQADSAFDPKALDAIHRFLELERQNRIALMAALPEKAEEIRKAEASVYILAFKKK